MTICLPTFYLYTISIVIDHKKKGKKGKPGSSSPQEK